VTVEWYVDDRPATAWTRLYVLGMRARHDQDAFTGAEHTLATARERQRSGDSRPTVLTRVLRRVRRRDHGALPAWSVSPWLRRPRLRLVHLHGGGYVHPLTPDYWRLVRALSTVPAEVVVPAYLLAPDHTVDEVLPLLRDLVTASDDRSLPLVLAGDSAGGALALVLGRELGAGAHRPAGLLLLCPWLDPSLRDPEVAELEATDPMLDETGLRAAARAWAGGRPVTDPRVAPLEGGLDGLPPTDVLIGDRDILRPAVDDLAARAGAVGARLRVWETTAMFHVWMTRAVPEGRRTRRHLVGLLRERARRGA
jgi:monoterpene epsilon-lactone hydrolase